jgi:hypothetical protein
MIMRSLALTGFAALSLPAMAHSGAHGEIAAADLAAHAASSPFHLIPLVAAIAIVVALACKIRIRAFARNRRDR